MHASKHGTVHWAELTPDETQYFFKLGAVHLGTQLFGEPHHFLLAIGHSRSFHVKAIPVVVEYLLMAI